MPPADGARAPLTDAHQTGLATALDWYATMPDPTLAAEYAGQASIRRYTGTPPEMHQPAMSDNLVCMHLGGAKEVRRWHDGRQDVHNVDFGAMTIMPANQTNRWRTQGPIDFAHLMLGPDLVRQIMLEEFDRDPLGFSLADTVGFRDPHLEFLFAELLSAIENQKAYGRLYADSLLVVTVVRLLRGHSNLIGPATAPSGSGAQRGGMAPWRLHRVTDYMRTHMSADVSLADLTAVAGLSRAQFFRAFRQSTGLSPHRYLTTLRLDKAKLLLSDRGITTAEVGHSVGVTSPTRLTSLFRRRFGLTPRAYRSTRS